MKFRKKPVVIEAIQFNKALRDSLILDGAPVPEGLIYGGATYHQANRTVQSSTFYIETLEGRMRVEIDDWIITGVKGEHYPCKPNIFEMTYEPA